MLWVKRLHVYQHYSFSMQNLELKSENLEKPGKIIVLGVSQGNAGKIKGKLKNMNN